MSDDDSDEEERTQLNVEVDDPDETADRSRALAKAMGVLPSDAEGSTLMADPDRMRRLAQQAANEVDQDDPASIVSFVSNVSVVTQSFEAPSPIAGPLPADVEPSTMGSITLDPASRAPADAEPITIEPRMGVRGMMPGPKPARSPIQSDVDTGVKKLDIQEEISTATVTHADVVRSAAADPAAAARLAKNAPRPAGNDVKALPKRSKTVIGLAPPAGASDVDGKEAETQSDVRVGTLPLAPATEPLPTAPLGKRAMTPMRERTNSEEALIAHALAIPETGGEFKPSTFQPLPDLPPATLAIPQTPPMVSPSVPRAPASTPAMLVASAAPGSSPGIVPDGPTPAGMVFENLAPPESRPKSNAGMIVGLVVGGLVLLGAGTAIGWVLRSARMPVSAATTAAPAHATGTASAEPEKKDEKKEPDVEAKSDPDPEKKPDLEVKNDPPAAADKPEKTDTAKKPHKPAGTKPPPWRPAAPKPTAKAVPAPVPPPAPTPSQPKGFDPNGI